MDLDMAHSIEVLTVSTSSSPGTSVKNVVPLQVELAKYPILRRDEGNKLRRPVRPIDRQRMRPWLMELLDLGNVFGLRWTNRHQGVFQISWRHASRLGWNLETDGDVFERWARHTGIYKEGDPPEPKRWKANFRCALHSLHDVAELTNAVERRGRNACRTYRFLQSSDEQSIRRKRAKSRRAKEIQDQPEQKRLKEMIPVNLESGSSEEIVSDAESEASHKDKVIVQTLDMKPDIQGEEFCLHHDHDYAGLDKIQKTIVLRQGVGSIVLQKEVQNAPEATYEVQSLLMSNLDQLASAAMNSAGIEAVQPQESDSRYTVEMTSSNIESFVKIPHVSLLNDSELREPDFSLRHFLMERNVLGNNPVMNDKSTRRRKSLAFVDDSFGVDLAESELATAHQRENRKSSICVSPQEKLRYESSIEPSESQSFSVFPPKQRSGSPKIHCRRSKRNRARSEKCTLEPSEPLMSSCLLLLEAATRLDNAEKTGMPSLSSKIVDKQNFNVVADGSCKIKANAHADLSFQSSQLKYENQACVLKQAKASSHMASFEILRTTLENAESGIEYGNNICKSKAIKHLFQDSNTATIINAVSSSNGTVIATEAPFATGLFSGSNIDSGNSLSLTWNKHGEDKGGMRLSKSKIFVYEKAAIEHESATASENEKEIKRIVSESILSCTPNLSTVKSSSNVQQVIIQRALPIINTSLKRTITSQFDTFSPIVIAHAVSSGGHSPQIHVSAGNISMDPAPHIEHSNQECVVVTSAIQDNPIFPLSTSSTKMKEQSYLPLHSIEKMHMTDTSNSLTILTSAHGSQNVCSSNSSVSETHPKTALRSSFGSVTVSPAAALRTVTSASCLPAVSFFSDITPVKMLPICSKTKINIAKSETQGFIHSEGEQNIIPFKSASTIPSGCMLENSPTISKDDSLSSTQENDLFICEPAKKVTNEIELHVLPLTSSSFTRMQTDINNLTSTNFCKDRRSGNISETVSSEESNKTWLQQSLRSSLPKIIQPQMRTVSVLPSSCLFTSTNNAATSKEEKSSMPVLINGTFTMDDSAMPTIITQETDKISPVEKENAFSDLMMKVSSTKTIPVHIPSLTVHQVGKVTHSDIFSNDSEMTLLHCSSDASLLNHTSVVLDFKQDLQANTITENENKINQKQESSSLLPCNESLSVKSLAELCKKYLAHLFSALDNQTSESDENDSATESPHLELINDTFSTTQYKGMMQAVTTLHQKHNCMKSESQETSILLCPSRYEFQSENAIISDPITTKRGLVYSISDAMINVQRHLSETTKLSNLQQNLDQQDIVCNETPVKTNQDINILENMSPTTARESQVAFNCGIIMDPTAPISIGEIPLFASSKGDSDSQSLVSD